LLCEFADRPLLPGLASLQASVAQYGRTALGSALRLTLVTQQLRPQIDPLTGERPPPDFSEARELLADTCSDSGIAALKWQLLQRHAGATPMDMNNRAETGVTAWDGTTSRRGKTMPTYSDVSLQTWGPSLHFCFNESRLRGPVSAAMPRLARDLRRQKPLRIVIVDTEIMRATAVAPTCSGARRDSADGVIQ
jgi:hypothetical protein